MRYAFSLFGGVALLCAEASALPNAGVSRRQTPGTLQDPPADSLSYTIPAPPATGGDGQLWQQAFQRARDVVDQMTLEERVCLGFEASSSLNIADNMLQVNMATGQAGLCIGNTAAIPRLGVPALCMSDGPAGRTSTVTVQVFVSRAKPVQFSATGARPARGVTQFPAGITTAATWDRELIYNRSNAMGQEFYDQGVVSRVRLRAVPVASRANHLTLHYSTSHLRRSQAELWVELFSMVERLRASPRIPTRPAKLPTTLSKACKMQVLSLLPNTSSVMNRCVGGCLHDD
jgi:hypothetical protein